MAKIFGKKKLLKQGEIKLLSTIWQLQKKDNFSRDVSRDEILEATGWRKTQFYSYFNDLRNRSFNNYIQGGNPYSLASNNLITKTTTAEIISKLTVFANSHQELCPDGQIPILEFIAWISQENKYSNEIVTEVLETLIKKKYLTQFEREKDSPCNGQEKVE